MNYKEVKNIVEPILQQQTLYQLNQVRVFVDNSLKNALTQQFKDEEDKSKYLVDTLFGIRDFVMTQTSENSLRLQLLKKISSIEESELLGNSQQNSEEEILNQTEESQVQDQPKIKEKIIESTTNS